VSRLESRLQRIEEKRKDWATYGGWPGDQRPWNRPCRGRVRVLNFWSRPPTEEEEVAAALPREPRRAVGFEGFGGFAFGFGFGFFAGAAVREMPLNCWRLNKINAPSLVSLVGWQAVCPLVHWSSWQAPLRPSACSPQCITSSRASCPPPAPRCRRSTAEPLAGALRPSTGPWRFAGRRSPPRLAGARTAPWPSPPNPPAPKPA
jgi:hypothetical protein